MANKRGRKRKSGERYPSGDLKPVIAPALWGRIRDIDGRHNPIFRTELSRLSFHGELSNTQTLAGFYIGDIYRRYYDQKNPPKTPHGWNSLDKTGLRLSSRQPLVFSAEKMSEKEWRTIENEVEALPQKLRSAVLDLCVLNEPINPMIYPEVCRFLDRIAHICEADWAHYQAPGLTVPKRRASTKAAAKPSDDDVDGAAVEKILLRLRPDLKAKEVSDMRDMFLAYRDRENFRQEKHANGKALRRERFGNPSRARKE
jgi:hypothetical protein